MLHCQERDCLVGPQDVRRRVKGSLELQLVHGCVGRMPEPALMQCYQPLYSSVFFDKAEDSPY